MRIKMTTKKRTQRPLLTDYILADKIIGAWYNFICRLLYVYWGVARLGG